MATFEIEAFSPIRISADSSLNEFIADLFALKTQSLDSFIILLRAEKSFLESKIQAGFCQI